jgi:exonuclease III
MLKECNEKLLKRFNANQDYSWLYNSAHGKSGGILVGVKKELYDVRSFHKGDYMLQLNLWDKINKIKWNLLVVYGAAQEEYKMSFLTELSAFCSRNKEPILIGGDFNIIRYAKERNKPGGIQRYSDTFNALINFHELRELEMSGGLFAWSNNQDNPTSEKLDRILIFKSWEDVFPNTLVKKLPREVSDHNPLILFSEICSAQRHIEFKFELSWLNHPDFIPNVKKIWTKPYRAK